MVKVCPDCHKTFSTAFCVARHQRCSHRGERPFPCHYCSQNFGYKHVLLHHISKKHPQNQTYEQAFSPDLRCAINIPRLTHMLVQSAGSEVPRSVHISQISGFSVTTEYTVLPRIVEVTAQHELLPGFEEVGGVKGSKWSPRF